MVVGSLTVYVYTHQNALEHKRVLLFRLSTGHADNEDDNNNNSGCNCFYGGTSHIVSLLLRLGGEKDSVVDFMHGPLPSTLPTKPGSNPAVRVSSSPYPLLIRLLPYCYVVTPTLSWSQAFASSLYKFDPSWQVLFLSKTFLFNQAFLI